MAKDAMLQVRLDAALKKEADELFRARGTTLSEAVRDFARQSVAVGRPTLREELPSSAGQRESAFGILAAYADEGGRAQEKEAWRAAAIRKHGRGGDGA